ncbi:MAG: hypothetical protein ABH806_03505 [Candidatus Omnitrophota bacterium]
MLIKQHIIVGTLVAAAVSWYVSPKAGISVLAAGALMDVDHYLWYTIKFKDWSLRRAMRFFEAKEVDNYYCLCVLHTVEAIAVYIACALLMRGTIFWISVGCIIHMALDVADSIRGRGLLLRKWSLIHAILFRIRGE